MKSIIVYKLMSTGYLFLLKGRLNCYFQAHQNLKIVENVIESKILLERKLSQNSLKRKRRQI